MLIFVKTSPASYLIHRYVAWVNWSFLASCSCNSYGIYKWYKFSDHYFCRTSLSQWQGCCLIGCSPHVRAKTKVRDIKVLSCHAYSCQSDERSPKLIFWLVLAWISAIFYCRIYVKYLCEDDSSIFNICSLQNTPHVIENLF